MKVKFNEIGRSMLEMLGVLAVTGVLSVGGIMGYRFAMDKYRANETLNELQIRVADLSRQMLNGIIELSVDEMGDRTRMGYPIRARISPQYADYFEVFLDEVPSGVCRQLLKSQWTIPYSIFVGTTEYEIDASICNEAETVTLAYEFKDDLTEKKFIEEEERHETWRCYRDNDCKCATCEQGLCKTMCPENSGCAKSYDNPNSWMCCLKDSIVSGLCCTSIGENGECCDSNNKCCPKDKPLRDQDGNCYACDDEKQVNIEGTIENCAVCSNRLVSGSKKYCVLKCGLKGTSNENKPLMDTDGKCHACDNEVNVNVTKVTDNCNKCSNRYLVTGTWTGDYCALCGVAGSTVEDKKALNTFGTCQSCEDSNLINVNGIESSCLSICPNRILLGDKCYPTCPADKPLRASDGNCYPCDYELTVPLSGIAGGKCKEVCPNRKIENEKCVLDGCPSTKPLMDTNGGCHACDEEAGVNVTGVLDNCKKCPSRYLVTGTFTGDYCALCGVAGTTVSDKKALNTFGTCQSCEDSNLINVHGIESSCLSLCPNRMLIGDKCYPACPTDKPLRASDGECHACDWNGIIKFSEVPDCLTLCPIRAKSGHKEEYCTLATCPADKPLIDKDGKCFACDEEAGVNVTGVLDNCKKCPNRYLVKGTFTGDYCALCGVIGTTVADKKILDTWGVCQSCNNSNLINVHGIESSCLSICPNRTLVEDKCYREYCSETVPLEDIDGKCHPCNEPLPIDVGGDETKCSCINRTLDGQYCILNDSTS